MSHHLTNDIISLVLKANDGHWWPSELLRLILVSQTWVGPVRRRLFAHPVIHSFHECNLLARTLMENPIIGGLVRGITLLPLSQGQSLTSKDATSLRFLLNLRGLRRVTLGGDLASCAERFLHTMTHSRTILSLHMDGSRLRNFLESTTCASLEWDEVLAYKFSNLRELRLTNIVLSIVPPAMLYTLHIEQLILDSVTIADGTLHDLLHDCWESIRILHVSICTKEPQELETQLHDVLASCEQLQSFSLELKEAHQSNVDPQLIIPFAPRLKHLALAHVAVTPQILEVICMMFKGLEELSIVGHCGRTTAEQWVGFIRSDSLPSLQVLRTSYGTNMPPYTQWSESMKEVVADVCAARGIALRQ